MYNDVAVSCRKVSSMAASRIVSGVSVTWASQGAFKI